MSIVAGTTGAIEGVLSVHTVITDADGRRESQETNCLIRISAGDTLTLDSFGNRQVSVELPADIASAIRDAVAELGGDPVRLGG